MSRFEHLVFVCTNEGQSGDTRARCGKQGSPQLLERLKAEVLQRGYKGRIRVVRSGCLDLCARGCAAFVHMGGKAPKERWYIHLTEDNAAQLLDELTGRTADSEGAARQPLAVLPERSTP